MTPTTPLLSDLERRLLTLLRQWSPEIVSFCQRLLQTPSVNGVHDERAVAEVIAEQAQRLGLHTQIVALDPRRPNVIVSTAAQGETGLLLLGHLDTVPPGDESRWTYPPYAGAIVGGRLYGRGAIDTKGGMAAALYALGALRALATLQGTTDTDMDAAGKGRTQARAQLICVPDEESGATGTLGVRFLHDQGLLGAAGAIYAYSGDKLLLGHRGLIRYRVQCTGEMIHTGMPEWQEGTAGANAVLGMAWLLAALDRRSTHLSYSTTPHFERFRTLITPGTLINGGVGAGMVPDRCEALVDVRLTPEHTLTSITALLEEVMRDLSHAHQRLTYRYDVLNHIPAAISDERAPLFSTAEGVIEALTGAKPPRQVAGPANEGYLLIERGIPCLCGLGPAGENAHAIDEYVEIDSLTQAASVFALTALRLSHVS
jgi:acetylornithine deacetylase/succinyl-diaminopimelate desuccinylase-like protein